MDKIPLDEATLVLMEDAMNAAYDIDLETGDPVLVNGEFSMNSLLMFFSGVDKDSARQDDDGWWVYDEPIYTRDDVIRALIAEVRTLRGV